MEITTNEQGNLQLTGIYNPLDLVSNSREKLTVCMRDSGFELTYNGVTIECKDGFASVIQPSKKTQLDFYQELKSLLNRYSMENGSDTPDFVLARFITTSLMNFDEAITSRNKFHREGIINGRGIGEANQAMPAGEPVKNNVTWIQHPEKGKIGPAWVHEPNASYPITPRESYHGINSNPPEPLYGLGRIDDKSFGGQILMGAIALITGSYETNKTPDQVLWLIFRSVCVMYGAPGANFLDYIFKEEGGAGNEEK